MKKATVLDPIRDGFKIVHNIGDEVEIRHWNQAGTCTVMNKDNNGCLTGIPIEKLKIIDEA